MIFLQSKTIGTTTKNDQRMLGDWWRESFTAKGNGAIFQDG